MPDVPPAAAAGREYHRAQPAAEQRAEHAEDRAVNVERPVAEEQMKPLKRQRVYKREERDKILQRPAADDQHQQEAEGHEQAGGQHYELRQAHSGVGYGGIDAAQGVEVHVVLPAVSGREEYHAERYQIPQRHEPQRLPLRGNAAPLAHGKAGYQKNTRTENQRREAETRICI